MPTDQPTEIRLEVRELDAAERSDDETTNDGPQFRCRMHVVTKGGQVISDTMNGRWTIAYPGLSAYDESVIRELVEERFADTDDHDRWWAVMPALRKARVDITPEGLDELPFVIDVSLSSRAPESSAVTRHPSVDFATLVEGLQALRGDRVTVTVRATPPSDPMWLLESQSELARLAATGETVTLFLGDHTTIVIHGDDLTFVEVDKGNVSAGVGPILVAVRRP